MRTVKIIIQIIAVILCGCSITFAAMPPFYGKEYVSVETNIHDDFDGPVSIPKWWFCSMDIQYNNQATPGGMMAQDYKGAIAWYFPISDNCQPDVYGYYNFTIVNNSADMSNDGCAVYIKCNNDGSLDVIILTPTTNYNKDGKGQFHLIPRQQISLNGDN